MAHYAQLINNVVVHVFVGRDEDDLADGVADWEIYYAPVDYTVKRTSYNTRAGVHYNPDTGKPSSDQSKAFRGNYAGIGFTYDEALDAFIEPMPSEGEWVLDADTFSWVEVEDEAG